MTWVLQDKTPFIVTQKCDGSSGTYILERKGKNKFEFYVCSRNVRILNDKQECYHASKFQYLPELQHHASPFSSPLQPSGPAYTPAALQQIRLYPPHITLPVMRAVINKPLEKLLFMFTHTPKKYILTTLPPSSLAWPQATKRIKQNCKLYGNIAIKKRPCFYNQQKRKLLF